jgi:nucleotidyltransferase/DNA polymerase involved in DNA repair
MRYIAYVDMDAYYVSCEIRERPELEDAPVLVGRAPTSPEARGVVLSASYAARKFGVRSAMPVLQAARRCPQAIWIPPDLPKYGRIAGEIRDLLATRAERVIPLSIDEAALELDLEDPEPVRAWAASVQELLKERLGLPSSIGGSPYSIVAKIASDAAKPGGIRIVPPEETRAFLEPLPARAIPGIGPKTAQRLDQAGFHTVGELATGSTETLRRLLGRYADSVHALARGTPSQEMGRLPEDRGPRQHSLDRTLAHDTRDATEIRQMLTEMAGELSGLLAQEGLRYQSIVVRLRWEDFSQTQRGRQLPASHEGAAMLESEAIRLATDLLERERGERDRAVRRVSLSAGSFAPRRGRQTLLDEAAA